MNNHLIHSTATFIGSLLGYYIAQDTERDRIPMMMLGGFTAGCIAHFLLEKKEEAKWFFGVWSQS